MVKSQKNKERHCEISIFQTSVPRPQGTSAQLLLVLTTFVICLLVAMLFCEEEQKPNYIRASLNSR